jgi:predicted transposase/invertase (TIGR01784 family)
MLITALEKEREKIFKEGIEKGVEKGIEKGKIDTAKTMHTKGMSISLISEVTGLSEERLLQILKHS